MAKRGYDRPFSSALTAASSILANLIPPSLGLIIYAALASVSVGAIFVATIVPGLLVAATLMAMVYLISRLRGYGGDMPKASLSQRMSSVSLAIPALMLPVFIVGGARFAMFTATEAGVMAFVYAILCGAFLCRKLTARNLLAAIREAVQDTAGDPRADPCSFGRSGRRRPDPFRHRDRDEPGDRCAHSAAGCAGVHHRARRRGRTGRNVPRGDPPSYWR
jgi:hypothetical protein